MHGLASVENCGKVFESWLPLIFAATRIGIQVYRDGATIPSLAKAQPRHLLGWVEVVPGVSNYQFGDGLVFEGL